ncbi:MAG: hypothetical protein EB034_25505, partial [Verrucomicrobia bacterium]|nr:hypothetical protein [Verrucomicrobiota bacterium]
MPLAVIEKLAFEPVGMNTSTGCVITSGAVGSAVPTRVMKLNGIWLKSRNSPAMNNRSWLSKALALTLALLAL